jgi:hypothetical protein
MNPRMLHQARRHQNESAPQPGNAQAQLTWIF